MRGSDKTVHEAFYGTRPDNGFIADTEWGCRAYLHVDKNRRKDGKWDETAIPLIFVGTARHLGYKAYILSNKDGSKQYIARHNVTFDRTAFPWRKAELPADELAEPLELGPGGVEVMIGEKEPAESGPSQPPAAPSIPVGRAAPALPSRITQADAEGPGPELIGDGSSIADPKVIINMTLEEERQSEEHKPERVRTRSMTRKLESETEQELKRRKESSELMQAPSTKERQNQAIQLPTGQQGVWDDLAKATDDFLGNVQDFVDKRRTTESGESNHATHTCSPNCTFSYANRTAPLPTDNLDTYHAWLKSALNIVPDIAGKSQALLMAFISTADEPKTVAEALARDEPECEKWWEATMQEIESWRVLEVFDTIDECDVPEGCDIIDSRIVYKLKLDERNNPLRYKARIVARGFMESDPGDTFAPMAHPITIRLLISIAIANGWSIMQSDCKTAYLNAKLPKPVYLRPPKGLESIVGNGKVMRLKRAVYGLGASGRLWYQLFTQKNREFGMTSITADDCVFSVRRGNSILICAIVVDDVLQITNDDSLRKEWLNYMRDFFEVTDEGPLKWYLGVNYIPQPNGDLLASQKAYLQRCLEKYKLTGIKPQTTPMKHRFEINIADLPENPDPKHVAEMRAKIGSLIFLNIWTRPDIAFAVNYLARFTLRANRECLSAVDHIFAYLKHTQDKGIRFKAKPTNAEGKNVLVAYADTSDADCTMTSKSTGGYILFINGAPIAWKSGRLPLVTLSSAESEYVELTLAAQEIISLRETLALLGLEQVATTVYEDNQAAIAICNNPCHRSRTRHIRRRYHFIRQCVKDGDIYVVYIQSAENVADMLTKPTPEPLFRFQSRRALNEIDG